MSVLLILAILALLLTIASLVSPRVPLWAAVLVLALYAVVQSAALRL